MQRKGLHISENPFSEDSNAFGGNISRELVQGTCHPAYSGSPTPIEVNWDPPGPQADAAFHITRVDARKFSQHKCCYCCDFYF